MKQLYCDNFGSAWTVPDYSTVASEVRVLTWKAPTSNHSCLNARKEKTAFHFTNVCPKRLTTPNFTLYLDIVMHYVASIKRKLMTSTMFLAPVVDE